MKQTLRNRIISYFKRNPDTFICGGEIQKLAGENGYEPQNAGRRLRELENDGILIRELRKSKNGSKVAWYRLSPAKYKTVEFYIPSENKVIKQGSLI